MKPIRCYFILNTSYGYCCAPVWCDSVREALRAVRASGMRYRIFDEEGKLIKRG